MRKTAKELEQEYGSQSSTMDRRLLYEILMQLAHRNDHHDIHATTPTTTVTTGTVPRPRKGEKP